MGRSGTSSLRRRRFDRVPAASRAALVDDLDRHYQSWTDALDDRQREAIRSYTHIHYTLVNAYLRGWDCDALGDRLVVSRTEALVEALDEVAAGCALPFPLIVHRGVKGSMFSDPAALAGMTLHDPGFLSVSLDRQTARKFSRRYHEHDYRHQLPAALMEIELPAGYPALYLGADPYLVPGGLEERELILARGSSLVVDQVDCGGRLPLLRCRAAFV